MVIFFPVNKIYYKSKLLFLVHFYFRQDLMWSFLTHYKAKDHFMSYLPVFNYWVLNLQCFTNMWGKCDDRNQIWFSPQQKVILPTQLYPQAINFKKLFLNFIYFTSQQQFYPLISLHDFPPFPPTPHPLLFSFCLGRSRHSIGNKAYQSIAYQVALRISTFPCIMAGQGNPVWKIDFQEPLKALGKAPAAIVRSLASRLSYTTATYM